MSSLTLKPTFLLQSYGSSSVDNRRLCSLISFQKKKTFRKQRFTLRAQSFDSSQENNENDSKNDSKPPNGTMQKSRREILLEYVQNVQPEFMELFVKRAPQQVVDAMRQTVTNMIGTLPPQFFAITVTTVAENLAQLMYSVLMTGYMFRNAQFRLELQQSLEQAALPEAQEEKDSPDYASGTQKKVTGEVIRWSNVTGPEKIDALKYIELLEAEVEELNRQMERKSGSGYNELLEYLKTLEPQNIKELTSTAGEDVVLKRRTLVYPHIQAYTYIEREKENHSAAFLERERGEMGLTGVTFLITLMMLTAVTIPANGCSPADQAALMDFKAALNEPYLGIFKTWAGTNCCQGWNGVGCDPNTQRVADIVLRGESEDPIYEKAGRSGYMTGSLSPSLCKLDGLTTFIVADWKDISGEIPACLTSLKNLRIVDLIGNKITGQIPANIGQLSKLAVLNLADNQISGSIPGSIVNLGKLMHLDLSNNQLSGEIPADIGKLSMMSRALLNKNKLTGSIPNSISKLYRLADLDLAMNQITGSIPAQLGSMPVLSTLNLDSNQLSGSIPNNLLSCPGLNILNLSRNSLEGLLPDVFGSKTYFTHLDLSYNNLRGSIPKSLASAKYIGHLDLSYNHLCGPIPNCSPFDHLEASSFSNNDCLCGSPLRTC